MDERLDREAPSVSMTHEEAVDLYTEFLTAKEDELNEAIEDCNFYDGYQWADKDEEVLTEREQPILTFNRIKPKINAILGQEIRTRVDPSALPRTFMHEDSRFAVTDVLRYIHDKLKFDKIRSMLVKDVLVPGCGAVVSGWDGEFITTRRIPWRQFWYDVRSMEPDFCDAGHLGVHAWWNLDKALDDPQYGDTPEKRQILNDSIMDSGGMSTGSAGRDKPEIWYNKQQNRVKIIEIYWLEGNQWFVAHYTVAGWLIPPQPVPYVDDTEEAKSWCPIKATSCSVVQEHDLRAGERVGLVRTMKDPQREINNRRSKLLFNANVYGAIAEEGAIPNPGEFRLQLSRPDGIAIVRKGALRDGSVVIRDGREISAENLQLLADAKLEIDSVGPSLPVTGGDNSVLSGRAILAKQSIGSLELETYFEHIRELDLAVYTCWWYLVRMYWSEAMHLRVTDSKLREGYRFVGINTPMSRANRLAELLQKEVPLESALKQLALPPGWLEIALPTAQKLVQMQLASLLARQGIDPQQIPPEVQQEMQGMQQDLLIDVLSREPIMQEMIKSHDMAQLEMDIIIDTSPDTSIAAREEFAELVNLFSEGRIHDLPQPLLIALVKNSDIRGKDEIIEGLTQVDPVQQQMAQQQVMANIELLKASVQEILSRMQLNQAKVMSEQASAMEKQAKATVGIPAEAEKDTAVGMHAAAQAGAKTVPQGQ